MTDDELKAIRVHGDEKAPRFCYVDPYDGYQLLLEARRLRAFAVEVERIATKHGYATPEGIGNVFQFLDARLAHNRRSESEIERLRDVLRRVVAARDESYSDAFGRPRRAYVGDLVGIAQEALERR